MLRFGCWLILIGILGGLFGTVASMASAFEVLTHSDDRVRILEVNHAGIQDDVQMALISTAIGALIAACGLGLIVIGLVRRRMRVRSARHVDY